MWPLRKGGDGFQSATAELLVIYAPTVGTCVFYGHDTATLLFTLSLWFKYMPPNMCDTLKIRIYQAEIIYSYDRGHELL